LKESGVINIDELGIKKKLIRGERLSAYKNEVKTQTEYFFEGDEPYTMATVTEPPEFAISDRDSYAVTNP
jgi:hypothetical protein